HGQQLAGLRRRQRRPGDASLGGPMTLTLGPFRFLSFSGDLDDLAAGRERTDALRDLDTRLPQPNSLRRAGDDTKAAVLASTDLLRAEGVPIQERLGLYVG